MFAMGEIGKMHDMTANNNKKFFIVTNNIIF